MANTLGQVPFGVWPHFLKYIYFEDIQALLSTGDTQIRLRLASSVKSIRFRLPQANPPPILCLLPSLETIEILSPDRNASAIDLNNEGAGGCPLLGYLQTLHAIAATSRSVLNTPSGTPIRRDISIKTDFISVTAPFADIEGALTPLTFIRLKRRRSHLAFVLQSLDCLPAVLEALFLDFTRITASAGFSFQQTFPHLRILHLRGLTVAASASVLTLAPSLEELRIAYAPMGAIWTEPDFLSTWIPPNLQTLSLSCFLKIESPLPYSPTSLEVRSADNSFLNHMLGYLYENDANIAQVSANGASIALPLYIGGQAASAPQAAWLGQLNAQDRAALPAGIILGPIFTNLRDLRLPPSSEQSIWENLPPIPQGARSAYLALLLGTTALGPLQ